MSANPLFAIRARVADETGSMVIALMAVIVASGLMLAVSTYALAGHQGARLDRDHTRVIQGADAGVMETLHRLNLPVTDPQKITGVWPGPTTSELSTPASAGDNATFRYRVEPWPAGQDAKWKVESYGTINGVTRHVRAIVGKPTPFQFAAFADSHMVLRGDNSADSYPATGQGDVGSNGNITLNGNVVADGVEVHDWATDQSSARCVSNGNTLCTTDRTNLEPEQDLTSDAALGFITEGIADTPACATPVPWNGTALGPGVHCFSTMNFTANINFTGTTTNPTIVYLTGGAAGTPVLAVGNKVRVNCPTVSGGLCNPKPAASKLQIYTKSNADVRIGNYTHFAGVIYAPRSSCRGNPSNAQGNIYGSMICGIITNQGGWQFHYDESLGSVGAGSFDVLRWSED